MDSFQFATGHGEPAAGTWMRQVSAQAGTWYRTVSSASAMGAISFVVDHKACPDIPMRQGLTKMQTTVNIATTMVGSSVLVLPAIAKASGLILGPILLIAVALVLMQVARAFDVAMAAIDSNTPEKKVKTFEAFAKVAAGTPGEWLVRFSVTSFIYGFLVVYSVLISKNCQALALRLFGIEWSSNVWLVIPAPIFLAMSQITNLSKVAKLSVFGMISAFVSIAVVVGKSTWDAGITSNWTPEQRLQLHQMWPTNLPKLLPKLPIYLSTYGVIMMLPAFRGQMQDPGEFFSAFRIAFLFVASLFVLLMICGYSAYGFFTSDSVMFNLMFSPADYDEATNIRFEQWTGQNQPICGNLMAIMVTLNLSLTFPILFTAVMGAFEKSLPGGCTAAVIGSTQNRLMRVIAVLLMVAIELSCGFFLELVSVLAALCGSLNSVLLPVFFSWKVRMAMAMPAASWTQRFCSAIAVAFALLCLIIGLPTAVAELLVAMRNA